MRANPRRKVKKSVGRTPHLARRENSLEVSPNVVTHFKP